MILAIPEQPNSTTFTLLNSPLGGDYILFVVAEFALNAPNPLETEEGFGRLFALAGPEPETFFAAVAGNPDAIDLAYSHSKDAWIAVKTSNFVLDPLNDAYYVWVPDTAVLGAAERLHLERAPRTQWMTKQALIASERYGDWLHGRVYNGEVLAFPVRYDDAGQAVSDPEPYYSSEAEPTYSIRLEDLYNWSLFRAELLDAATNIADAINHPELAL